MSETVRNEAFPPGRRILDFYSERSPDDRGRSFSEILAWSDRRLEEVHDYIQWLFPLPEPSGANPGAPVLDPQTIAEFRSDPALQAKLHRAFLRMLQFYGLKTGIKAGQDSVERAANFRLASSGWLAAGNHNHLRLTRILRSLRVLGLEQDALSLFARLRSIYEEEETTGRHRISSRSFRFWSEAAAGDLGLWREKPRSS